MAKLDVDLTSIPAEVVVSIGVRVGNPPTDYPVGEVIVPATFGSLSAKASVVADALEAFAERIEDTLQPDTAVGGPVASAGVGAS